MSRTRGALFAALASLAALVALPPRAARGEEEAAAKARAAIVAAAKKSPEALAKALDEAQALVGPQATFPDGGALADWLATFPGDVAEAPVMRSRRGWLYVVAKRGADAIRPLEQALEADPGSGALQAFLGDAKRQKGDGDGALAAFSKALQHGADVEYVVGNLRKLAYDAHADAPAGTVEGLPGWASLGERVLAAREIPDVRISLVRWLAGAAERARGEAPAQSAPLRAEAARLLWPALVRPSRDAEIAPLLPRMALEAALRARSLGERRPADVPEPFDFFAMAVRLGAPASGEGHEVPEALAGLAEEALGKGRYLLASVMARRRLAISDSPAARRVLLALPPDVGD